MDINCTNKCAHQRDGKCMLQNLDMNQVYGELAGEDCGCPYFAE